MQNLKANKSDLPSLADVERELIITTMQTYRGNVTKACASLGLGRSTLYRKIDEYKLTTYLKDARIGSEELPLAPGTLEKSFASQTTAKRAKAKKQTAARDIEGEYIVAAAVKIDNNCIIWLPSPARHGRVLFDHPVAKRMSINQLNRNQVQGFVTNRLRFIDRKQGLELATSNGQLLPRDPHQYNGPELFSEDLW